MILDTCALLWLPSGDPRLTPQARERLAAERTVSFCAISAFEIALKVRDRKLELPLPPARWVRAMVDHYGLTEIPLDAELCAAAAALPPYHRDPADRFIIAAAQRLRLPVVTVDQRFAAYGVELVH
ncbi:MAG: type II toxin-antitoxin system VapC family toxin [Pedosphaera sp.]|nr:type II toxin-antitoxin system VapC family toxin [Pedosphaera sp.]